MCGSDSFPEGISEGIPCTRRNFRILVSMSSKEKTGEEC
jgi:hypothetical protein